MRGDWKEKVMDDNTRKNEAMKVILVVHVCKEELTVVRFPLIFFFCLCLVSWLFETKEKGTAVRLPGWTSLCHYSLSLMN
ncbi:hypothetical protein COLO4_36008 [Corchorus olitorius]|uniref:Uncharacterized protein n=1 Tax=Corchorus olitorius TaxID=93759 RepID=A0A1R3GBF8_9ROSI|nr:hypothetical protein COLO4_36008 [Corchorus olitorius]